MFGKHTTYEDWAECLHPEDRARAEKAVIDTLEKRSPEYRNEYRIVVPSGGVRWVNVLGKVDYAADGAPLRVTGISLDITERKRTEEALRKAEEFHRQKSEELETILAAMPAAVIIAKDADCIEMTGNCAAYDLLRLAPHQDLSKSAPPERAPRNYEVFSNGRRLSADEMPIQRAVAGKNAILAEELEIRFMEGDSKFVLTNALPLFHENGEVRGAVGAFTDVTNLKRTEVALRESEDRLQFALEAAGAGTWEASLETGELRASDKALSFLGIALGTPVTHDIALARVHPDDRSRLEDALRHTLETGQPFKLGWRVPFPDGSVRWREARAERRSVSGKQVVAGLVLDITDRKHAEEALHESKAHLQFALEAAGAGTWEMTPETGELTASERAVALHGLPPGASIYPEDQPRVEEAFRRTLESSEPLKVETRVVLPGGSIRWIALCGELRSVSGKKTIAGLVQDITERKGAEEALRVSEERLRFALEAANAGTWEAVPETGEFTASDRALAMHGAPPGTPMSHEKAVEAVHPEDRPRVAEAVQCALETGEPYRAEFRMPLPDGSVRWVETRAEPRFVSGRQVLYGLLQDITERKHAEIALRESEERLRFALEAANAGTWEAVLETREFTSSDRALAMHGAPPGTPMSLEKALAVAHPEDQPRLEEGFRQVLEKKEPFRVEFRIPLPDGSVRWVEARGESRSVSGRQVISGLLQDITERKRAEIALRESGEILRAIIEHVPAPIILSREDRTILRINPALTALTGYRAADIPTRDEWENLAYREHAQEIRDTVHIAFESSMPLDRADLWVYTKSGEKRVWSVRTAPAGRDSSGQRLLVSVALDVTERRKSAEEARISRSRLEAALASMRDAVFIPTRRAASLTSTMPCDLPQIHIQGGMRQDIRRASRIFRVFLAERGIGTAGGMASAEGATRRNRDAF